MTLPAIRVHGLGKQYLLGQREHAGRSFRETLSDSVLRPIRWLTSKTPSREAIGGSFWALDDVSFDIQPGDVVGVIGRNGAGKSTLLKVLSRITAPTRGRVEIRGRIASLLEVGTGFHPELTGRENIRLNGAIIGMSGAEVRSKFDEIVDFAGVEQFIDTPVKRYSSGMLTRLAFAVAAHLDPEILVVDEVLAVGDAKFQKKCLGKMQDLSSGAGRTVLFVSHNMGLIRQICGKGIYLECGRLKLAGKIDEAAELYAADLVEVRGDRTSRTVLSEDLELCSVAVGEGTHLACEPARFAIEVLARVSTHLLELVLLIEKDNGEPIAAIDCRHTGFHRVLDAGERATVSGEIRSLDLVEGNYKVGVYWRTMATYGKLHDVLDLAVREPVSQREFTPYPPSFRGTSVLRVKFDGTNEEIIS